jgi:hypothetical protein
MMMPPDIPRRIEIMKKHLGITEDVEFGRLCGMSKSVVNQLMGGQIKSVAPRYAYSLEEKTGFSARWIMLGDPPERVDVSQAQQTANGGATFSAQSPVINYETNWEINALLTYFDAMSQEHRADLVAMAETWFLRDNPDAEPLVRIQEVEIKQKKSPRM